MGMMIHRNRKRKKEREISSDELNQRENLPFFNSNIRLDKNLAEKKYTKSEIQRIKQNCKKLQEIQELKV